MFKNLIVKKNVLNRPPKTKIQQKPNYQIVIKIRNNKRWSDQCP